jgi:hypothetical protein
MVRIQLNSDRALGAFSGFFEFTSSINHGIYIAWIIQSVKDDSVLNLWIPWTVSQSWASELLRSLQDVLCHCATSRKVSGSIPGGVTLGIFSVATDGTICPGVDSASKNEYQGFPLGVKAAGAWGWRPTTLVVPNVKKIRGLNLPGKPLGPCGLLWAWPLKDVLCSC